ncbi:ATP phosphoribosyltransferase regulatory subunit [Candidatus Bipolaricaulota bacterium]|nr:ATP phosphoribosyltransferase regulatory subunit [Candidatus Bipolaricaulota bacterium]
MNGNWINQSTSLSTVARVLRQNYDLWNYREILLPAIEEFEDELDKGTKFTDGMEFYVIKPDITSQILARLTDEKRRKLFYISEVLDGDTSGNWQFGAEYIGGDDLWMVLEIISSIITGLESLGIKDFFVDVGSKQVWESAISDIPDLREEVFSALYHRSFDLIDDLDITEEKKDQIWQLFNYRDKRCSYDRLNKILKNLDDERVFADFGTVRGMPYYEDLTFEIYSPGTGSPLGYGGEYTFFDSDACGFAFNLESVLEVFTGLERMERKKIGGPTKEKLTEAKNRIESGVPVEVES